MTALFERDHGRFVPTEYARGPWDPRALHGGPSAALAARAVERLTDAAPGLEVARLTVELLRPVPLAPLDVRAEVIRPGRKVEWVEVTISTSKGSPVVRARALRVRQAHLDLPADDHDTATPPAPPETATPDDSGFAVDHIAYHRDGAELRFAHGAWREPGPVRTWVRLKVPLLEGEEPTPLQRVAAAADFGNGISGLFDLGTHTFINADLSIHLIRPAVGEWIGLDAASYVSDQGTGQAESRLWDGTGRLGRAMQSLLVEKRP